MKRKRRTHSSEFKAKVALAAIQGDLTITELVKKFNVHVDQITDWNTQLLSGVPDVFGNGAREAEDAAETVQELHGKIGTMHVARTSWSAALIMRCVRDSSPPSNVSLSTAARSGRRLS